MIEISKEIQTELINKANSNYEIQCEKNGSIYQVPAERLTEITQSEIDGSYTVKLYNTNGLLYTGKYKV